MSRFVPLTPQRFGSKACRRIEGLDFARHVGMVPISAAEFPGAAHSMPIAFVAVEGGHAAVAIMGLTSGRNLFVAPDGRWLASYVPAMFRTYPFRLLERKDAPAERVLCIDEECQAIVDVEQGTGEPLFDPHGKFGSQVLKAIELMKQMEHDRLATERAIGELASSGVLRPLEIKPNPESGESLLRGLHRVDEVALSQISDSAFCGLRKAFALPLAYAHLLSLYHLATLSRLEAMHAELARRQAMLPETLNQAFKIPGEDTLVFD